jgi:hypothetical protein
MRLRVHTQLVMVNPCPFSRSTELLCRHWETDRCGGGSGSEWLVLPGLSELSFELSSGVAVYRYLSSQQMWLRNYLLLSHICEY